MSTDLRWLPARVEVYSVPARCKFLTAEAFLSLALQAYLGASKDLVPPPGEPWVDEGATWTNAESFYDGLLSQVADRLRLAALASGDLFERFYQEVSEATPLTAMAHGCAAVSPAAGAAPAGLQGRATRPDDPLFAAPEWQELPDGESIVHSPANRDLIS